MTSGDLDMYVPRPKLAFAALCILACVVACSDSGQGTSIATPAAPIVPTLTAKGKFLYTGNQGASLSGYSVNTSTGVLTALSGFPLALGENPTTITHDPQNRFVIVADIAADQIRVFAINATTGALTEVAPSPYYVPAASNSPYTVAEPVSLTVDPSGTHVYMVNQGSSQVEAYNLSSAGVLTPVAGAPFYTGSAGPTFSIGASSVLTNAAGTVLYVQDVNNVYVFAINSSTGALTLTQTLPGPYFGGALALDPTGAYLYAVGGTASIMTYAVNSNSGQITLAKSSPMAKGGAYTISVSPTGQFAYTIEDNNYLVSYELNGGSFTPVGTIYSAIYGQQIGIDPSGNFVYIPDACSNCPGGAYNAIHEFSVGSNGALTQLSTSPIAAGMTPWGVTITSQ